MRNALLILCILLIPGQLVARETCRTVHAFVALCDNDSQGIVPVPKKLGSGNDPRNNLYWGALYGVKTFFKKDADWTLVSSQENPAADILERCVFRHRSQKVFLVADAYRGSKIKKVLMQFLSASAGCDPKTLRVKGHAISVNGGADLVVYVGHNGLMDFKLKRSSRKKGNVPRDAVVLACRSKQYFQNRLSGLGCRSVLLTTGFMAPEAYTLEAALEGWIAGESGERIRSRAARAYHKYQKCGIKAAKRLFYAEEDKKKDTDTLSESDGKRRR